MDSTVLLDLLQTDTADGSDLQLAALEQLCFLVLQVDSADTLKKLYSPSLFVPVLVNLFFDNAVEPFILETTSRVLTYYLQTLPFETTAALSDQESVFSAITLRMSLCDLTVSIENDLAQQVIKVLEEYSKRETCVLKLVDGLSHIFDFILSNWQMIHLDTLISGLYVVSRLSNYMDIWVVKHMKKDGEESSAYIQEMRRWIFQLVDLVVHKDTNVTFGSLESLRNIVTSCRRLPQTVTPLHKITSDGHLLENLLGLLAPNAANNENSTTPIQAKHLQLTGSLAALVVDLIMNICYQHTDVIKSLAFSPIFHNQLAKILDSADDFSNNSKTPDHGVLNTEFVTPILDFIDGLLFLTLTMPRLGSIQSSDYLNPTDDAGECTGIHQICAKWHDYLRARRRIIQAKSDDIWAFRFALDNLGLSNDIDAVILRFHLWMQQALVNKINIVDILTALGSVQLKNCWYDFEGQSLLSWAVHSQYPSALMALANRGLDANAGLCTTPLHVAASEGNLAAARYLLSSVAERNLGLASNPLLCDSHGFTPRQCLKAPSNELGDLLLKAEEEFKTDFEGHRDSAAGQIMCLLLPLLAKAFRTSMRPSHRLKALRLITRICRSRHGYAVVNTTLKKQKARTEYNSQESLVSMLLGVITSTLSQGSTAEVSQAVCLIAAVLNQPGVAEALQRFGTPDILSWRISAEKKLVACTSKDVAGSEAEWKVFLPEQLMKPQVIQLPLAKGATSSASAKLKAPPQCIYELSLDQPYQFTDWTLLRTGNSSIFALQDYAALLVDVALRPAMSSLRDDTVSKVPTLIVTLVTRGDTPLPTSPGVSFTPEETRDENTKREGLDRLDAKVMTLCSAYDGEQLMESKDLASLWAKCVPFIKRIRSSICGVVPLPLCRNLTKTPTRKPHGPRVRCAPCLAKGPVSQHFSSSIDDANATPNPPSTPTATTITHPATTTTTASYISCDDGGASVAPPAVETSVSSPVSKASSSSSMDDPLIIDITNPSVRCIINRVVNGPTLTRSGTSESDCQSASATTVATTPAAVASVPAVTSDSLISAGLLSLSVTQGGLVIKLREGGGTEKYVNSLVSMDPAKVICDHPECRGEWDPDGYCPPNSEAVDNAKALSLGQVSPIKLGLAKVIISPMRVGGIRTFGNDGILVYKNNALARSGRLQRLHPIQDPLSFNQRKAIRDSHHACFLLSQRKLLVKRGSELLKALNATKRAEVSASLRLLKSITAVCKRMATLEVVKWNEKGLAVVTTPIHVDLLARATPHELISSGVLPCMLNCLKRHQARLQPSVLSQHHSTKFSSAHDLMLWPQLCALKHLLGPGLHVFIRKVVETFELVERYSVTSLNLTGHHNQLIQRSIHLQPKLQLPDRSREDTSGSVKPFSRRVDLSNYRLYTTPLVTLRDLQEWLENRITTTPWHEDALEYMGFTYDLSQKKHDIFLSPRPDTIANPENDTQRSVRGASSHVHCGGVFHWLSTNGGRELKNRINPTKLHRLVHIITSDAKINKRPLYLGRLVHSISEESVDDDDDVGVGKLTTSTLMSNPPPSVKPCIRIPTPFNAPQNQIGTALNRPWIFIDTGVCLEVGHYSLKVLLQPRQWPCLQHWQLLASVDRFSWDLLSEHHVNPEGQMPSNFWGCNGERSWAIAAKNGIAYRYYRLVGLPSPLSGEKRKESTKEITGSPEATERTQSKSIEVPPNALGLQGIEFFGRVRSICLDNQSEWNLALKAFVEKFKPGVFVVQNTSHQFSKTLQETWPQVSKSQPPSMTSLPPLGIVVSESDGKRFNVAWFHPTPVDHPKYGASRIVVQRSDDGNQQSGGEMAFDSQICRHTMDPDSILDLSLPDHDNEALQKFLVMVSSISETVENNESASPIKETKTMFPTLSNDHLLIQENENTSCSLSKVGEANVQKKASEFVNSSHKIPGTTAKTRSIFHSPVSPSGLSNDRKGKCFVYDLPNKGGVLRIRLEEFDKGSVVPPRAESTKLPKAVGSSQPKDANALQRRPHRNKMYFMNDKRKFNTNNCSDENEDENGSLNADPALTVTQQQIPTLAPFYLGPLTIADPGDSPINQELPLKASFVGAVSRQLAVSADDLASSFSYLLSSSNQPEGLGLTQFDLEHLLSAQRSIDTAVVGSGMGRLGRGPESLQHTRIATLNASIPGFIPPFDARAGSQSQPTTVTFDPVTALSEAMSAEQRKIRGSINAARVWLSSSDMDINEEGLLRPTLLALRSLKKSSFAQADVPLYAPTDLETSLFHCWAEGMQIDEEFPGCGKSGRSTSPTSGRWQRTYCLKYSVDGTDNAKASMDNKSPNAIVTKSEDSESIYSKIENLPLFITVAQNETNVKSTIKVTSAALTNQILTLLRTLHTITTSSELGFDEAESFRFLNDEMREHNDSSSFLALLPCAPEVFLSDRLARKLHAFTSNSWSVIYAAGKSLLERRQKELTAPSKKHNGPGENKADMSNWCRHLTREADFFFPFNTRLDLWRATSLGLSRSISWLQQQAGGQSLGSPSTGGGGGISLLGSTRLGSLRGGETEASGFLATFRSGFSAADFGGVWGPSNLLDSVRLAAQDGRENDCFSNSSVTPPAAETQIGPQFSQIPINRSPYSAPSNLHIGAGFASLLPNSSLLDGGIDMGRNDQTSSLGALGRLQREAAKVPRASSNVESSAVAPTESDVFWAATKALMTGHAGRKQELEVGFLDEEGTGLGPTMEFYALLSAEFRRKCHAMWVADYTNTEEFDGNSEEALKGGEIYATPRNGLFPSAWTPTALPTESEDKFRILGISLAKCLQDQRRMDLPLSQSFLRLLTNRQTFDSGNNRIPRLKDFVEIYPEKGEFFMRCLEYLDCVKAGGLRKDAREQLEVKIFSAKLDDLCLTMEFPAITPQFGTTSFTLEDRYSWEDFAVELGRQTPAAGTIEPVLVNFENLESYVRRTVDFAMNKGIAKQMELIINGFNEVFSIRTLSIFSPSELGKLIAGEDTIPVVWTYGELLNYFEPVAGYTRQSRGYLLLLEVLATLTGLERRAFVKFVTGCPNLPPGGFKNLHPTLKVAKKDAKAFGPFPSVNTCMHYLKLPEYENPEKLKENLLAATSQLGFYLN